MVPQAAPGLLFWFWVIGGVPKTQGYQITLNLVELAIVAVAVQNPGELDDLGLFVNRIDDPVFPLGDPESGETPIGEVAQLF